MKDQLKAAMKDAMKAKEKIRLETVRSLISAIQYEEMNKKVDELSSDQAIAVLKSEQKKQLESLEFAEKDNRDDLISETKERISVIESFLPQQLSEQELEKIITDAKAENADCNMGAIMKHLKESYAGQYDGKLASSVAKRLLG